MLPDDKNKNNIDEQNVIDINQQELELKRDSKSFPLWKNIVLFIVGCVGIYVASILASVIVKSFDIQGESEISGAATFITYSILICALLGVLNKDIIKLGKDWNWKAPLLALGFGVAMILFPIIYNLIVSIFRQPTINENEQGLRSFITLYPFPSLLILGFVGPFCEEITYRVGLFNIFKKHKWLAYIISILIFAFMHFSFTSTDIVNEFINLPVYLFSGFLLALAYDKFGFWCSLGAHITNNAYSVLMLLLAAALKIPGA